MAPPSHSSPRFFLGIDGGGSTTRAVIASEDGSLWGYGEAAGSNPHELGVPRALEHLKAAVSRAWLSLGQPAHPLSGAFLGIAGTTTLTDAERSQLTSWLSLDAGGISELDHDIRIALAGGLTGRAGIAVVAGTGSSGYGRAEDGRVARAGGWGGLLDDSGGGYWLGVRALRAVTRASDGRAPSTSLSEAILRQTGCREVRNILEWLRRPGIGRPEIASLAPTIFECARASDAAAQELVRDGARELVLIASTVARSLFREKGAEVVLTGGLSHIPEYRDAFRDELASSSPHLRFAPTEHSALTGALLLALKSRGVTPSRDWLETAHRSAV